MRLKVSIIVFLIGFIAIVVAIFFGWLMIKNKFSKKIATPPPQSSPTPMLSSPVISIACPVPKEFCSQAKEVDAGAEFSGLGFNLPAGTSVLAVFSGTITDEPKVKGRLSNEPLLYLTDLKGDMVVYSYYGTISSAVGKSVSAGSEIGKIGPGSFPVGPISGLNFLFSLKQGGKYQKISIKPGNP